MPFANIQGILELDEICDAQVRSHVDALTRFSVRGWAFADEAPLIIEAWNNDRCIGKATANLPRPDVGEAFSYVGNSATCGFDIPLLGSDVLTGDIVLKAGKPDWLGNATNTRQIERVRLA